MHPAVPFGGDLGTVIVHIYMRGKLDPTIPPIEVVRVFKVLVAVLVDANQRSDL